MRPLVELDEFLVKPSFVSQFRDLTVVNAQAFVEREAGFERFSALSDSPQPRRFALYEIYEDEAAFDEHLASNRYLSFANAIEDGIEQRSISRSAFSNAMPAGEDIST